MPRAISYVRFSHPNQALGASKQRQLDASRKYCAEHRLTLDESDIYIDEGKSAFSGAHLEAEFGRFRAAVEQGLVEPGSYLLVDTLNRISRDVPVEAIHQLTGILIRGIIVVTMADQQVYTKEAKDSHKLFYSLGLMIGAHAESANKARWVRDARARKRAAIQEAYQNSDSTGPRPILTQMLPAWVSYDRKLGRLVENESGKIVRRIFRDFADGIASHTLAARLNKEQVPLLTGSNRTVWKKKGHPREGQAIGRLWHPARIVNLIKSDVPLGWYQPYTRHRLTARKIEKRPAGPPIKDYYPQVVSYELAEQARAQLASRVIEGKPKGGRRGEYSNLFTGFAKCVCGEPMVTVSRTKGGKRWRWLHCRDPKCSNKASIRLDKLEAVVLRLTPWALQMEKSLPKFDRSAEISRTLAEKRAEAEKLNTASDNLIAEMGQAIGPLMRKQIDRLEARYAELQAEITELEKQLRSSAVQHDRFDAAEALRDKVLADMQSKDTNVRYAARAKLATAFRKTYDKITCNKDKLIRLDVVTWQTKLHTIRIWIDVDADVGRHEAWKDKIWMRVSLKDKPEKAFEFHQVMLPPSFIIYGIVKREESGGTIFDEDFGEWDGLSEKESTQLYWLVDDANQQTQVA